MTESSASAITAVVRALGPQVDAERLRRHVRILAGEPHSRRRSPEAMGRAEAYVDGELRASGWQVDRRPFDVRWQLGSTDRHGNRALPLKLRLHPRLRGANLIADLPGSRTEERPTVVIGAHLDTVDGSPGADDNSSGVAAILEIARLLGRLSTPPAVTLALFDMEELGLIGSRVVARELSRARPIAGMICLESVGVFSAKPGSQRLPPGFSRAFPDAARAVRAMEYRGDFTLVVHRRASDAAAELWRRTAAEASPALPGITLRDPRPDGVAGVLLGLAVPPLNHLGRSDHASFWNRRIPALMLTGTANFRNPHYHRPTDTPETLDYPRLASVTLATAVTALHWPRSR
ncbi:MULTISPECIES: M28 family peptidase [unclassified Streptomyces]|uniref:M28 family peptidase n=1 Tax=unclassified Streptomyces TaxID=2593676 RepID=UPI0022514FFF|nr:MULTISPECIES: M28 family peptidase [unclassified Streptomyces]MCX4406011.1 M28 family peptidase [Streptomyces sp. NBC_01764]MCX5189465.1 M28 family peptidase [Streptomyces sp. NBC_00268]